MRITIVQWSSFVIVLLLGILVGFRPAWAGPSFDCAKARTPVEKLVCSDTELGDLDGELARAYARTLQALGSDEAKELKFEQRAWLGGTRKEACASTINEGDPQPFRTCVTLMYRERIATLEAVGTGGGVFSGEGKLPQLPWRFADEQAKVTLAAELLRDAASMSEQHTPPPDGACSGILEALRREGEGITATEPDFEAATPDDPRVAAVLGHCPAPRVFDHFTHDPYDQSEEAFGRPLTYEERKEYWDRYVVTGRVRLYRVTNAAKSKNLKIVFGDQICRPGNYIACGGGQYDLFDFAACDSIWGRPVAETYSRYYHRVEPHASAIVTARGRQYVMSLSGPVDGYSQGRISFTDIADSVSGKQKVCAFNLPY
jgi:uncharacterized protein